MGKKNVFSGLCNVTATTIINSLCHVSVGCNSVTRRWKASALPKPSLFLHWLREIISDFFWNNGQKSLLTFKNVSLPVKHMQIKQTIRFFVPAFTPIKSLIVFPKWIHLRLRNNKKQRGTSILWDHSDLQSVIGGRCGVSPRCEGQHVDVHHSTSRNIYMNETLTHSVPEWRRSMSAAVLVQLRWNCFNYCDRTAGFIVYKCLQQPPPIPVKPWMCGFGSSIRLLPLRRRPAVTKPLVDVGDFRTLDSGRGQGSTLGSSDQSVHPLRTRPKLSAWVVFVWKKVLWSDLCAPWQDVNVAPWHHSHTR